LPPYVTDCHLPIVSLKGSRNFTKIIWEYAQAADILTISHYHYDHYFPEADFYKGKVLLIKDPNIKISRSQKGRGKEFLKWVNGGPQLIEFADGRNFKFRQTEINFSPPLYHGGDGSRLGYVLACSVKFRGKKLIHSSDVQGPQVSTTTDWIVQQNPDVLILSGFPTLLLGYRSSKFGSHQSRKNLLRILNATKVRTAILDHHLTRDLHYKNKTKEIVQEANRLKKKVITAAEYLGKEPELLEAKRKELSELEEKH
jgi:predicted metallo-beta-lactamase superfamily hydrolase